MDQAEAGKVNEQGPQLTRALGPPFVRWGWSRKSARPVAKIAGVFWRKRRLRLAEAAAHRLGIPRQRNLTMD